MPRRETRSGAAPESRRQECPGSSGLAPVGLELLVEVLLGARGVWTQAKADAKGVDDGPDELVARAARGVSPSVPRGRGGGCGGRSAEGLGGGLPARWWGRRWGRWEGWWRVGGGRCCRCRSSGSGVLIFPSRRRSQGPPAPDFLVVSRSAAALVVAFVFAVAASKEKGEAARGKSLSKSDLTKAWASPTTARGRGM